MAHIHIHIYIYIWVVVKIMIPLGYPKYSVPYYNGGPKGTTILTTSHICIEDMVYR